MFEFFASLTGFILGASAVLISVFWYSQIVDRCDDKGTHDWDKWQNVEWDTYWETWTQARVCHKCGKCVRREV